MSVRSVVPTIAGGQFLRRRGVREIALIGVLYLFYCVTRTFAEDDLGPAQDRAGDLLHLEKVLHLDWEHAINNWFVAHPAIAVPACYWYAAAHYVVTLTVLVWLFRKGAAHYSPARWALVVSCLIALACYLLLPTAPPRLTGGGYVDLLEPPLRRGLVGRRRLGSQGDGPAHQPARGVPEPARRLGAVGGARRTPQHPQLLVARPGLDARRHHRDRRHRHRKPLDPRRRCRLGRGDHRDVAGRPVVPRRARPGGGAVGVPRTHRRREDYAPPSRASGSRWPGPSASNPRAAGRATTTTADAA